MFQIFDAETDAKAGHIFQGEGAVGVKIGRGWTIEAGGLWRYSYLHGQGNRRLAMAGTDGAVISWNRQETRAQGFTLRVGRTF